MTDKTAKTDEWIPTVCNMCFNACAIKVHVVDGVAVEIEGNSDSPVGEGHVCGKGNSGLMLLYDPNRITKPLKRTNKRKGIDQDPGWREISWDEAYDTVAKVMQETLERSGPQALNAYGIVCNMPGVVFTSVVMGALFQNTGILMPDICGAGIHTTYEAYTTSGNARPDYDLCKYLLQFGTQAGTATRHGFNMTARRFAEAHVDKGMKYVCVDPHMSAGAEKADMWLPILPGTDAALAMGIAYVLVHELGIYDREYLKTRTNAAYLVDMETKRVIHDSESGKAMLWDSGFGKAKVYDDATIGSIALEGVFDVNGRKCTTGFSLYKEHIVGYTPEKVAKITTIPVETIRQVARELGEAANIGGNIVIEGQEYPYRPVAVDCFSGVSRHKHAILNHIAVLHLNLLLGSCNMPGGLISFAPICDGFTETSPLRWTPGLWEEDGLLEGSGLMNYMPKSIYRHIRERIGDPTGPNLLEIMPLNDFDTMFNYVAQLHPETYKVKPQEFLFIYGGNLQKNWGNHSEMADYLLSYKYIVQCDMYLNDTSYFADIILPEASYLERYDFLPNGHFNHHTPGALDVPWTIQMRQPVVPARDSCPGIYEIWMNIVNRMGLTPNLNGVLNYMYSFAGYGLAGDSVNIPMDRVPTMEELGNLIYQSMLGPEHDFEWFKKNGVYTRPRKANEMYIWPRLEGRIPFYWDFMYEAKEKVEEVVNRLGIPWETDDYQPMPDYKPCHDVVIHHEGYDLMPTYYTNAMNTDTWQLQNAYINEYNEADPYGYNIEINASTAKTKGLKTGDLVELRAPNGYKVTGRLFLTEGIHPQALAVSGGCFGSRSKYLPNAKDKGVPVNNLMSGTTPERMCHLSAGYDQCVRVKVTKIG